jgi:drug/metabolite transporter (DMT)-like permease
VAKFALHEEVSPLRWLGIALISGGVGFVAGGPALTAHEHAKDARNRAPAGVPGEEVVSGGLQP